MMKSQTTQQIDARIESLKMRMRRLRLMRKMAAMAEAEATLQALVKECRKEASNGQ